MPAAGISQFTLWFAAGGLLLLGTGCSRIGDHPLVNAAKEEVTLNERSHALLGQPLKWPGPVTGRANEVDGIAAMQIPVNGPKLAGTVVVEGKKFGDEWGVTLLEVRPDGAEKLSLTTDLAARIGVDTPAFDPNASASTPATNTAPPPAEISIDLPPGIPGQE